MCLNAARLPARLDGHGNLVALVDQDRSRWDATLITEGLKLLELSASGTTLSAYHIEAAIASLHATAPGTRQTDWRTISSLYDALMVVAPSPVAALNRAIAIAQAHGPERGLDEIRAIVDRDRLAAYPFYPAALGELELQTGQHAAAREHFQAALALSRSPMERRFINQRLRACSGVRQTNRR